MGFRIGRQFEPTVYCKFIRQGKIFSEMKPAKIVHVCKVISTQLWCINLYLQLPLDSQYGVFRVFSR